MGRFQCPQCRRGFGSVGEMLNHTEQVHAGAEAASDFAEPVIHSRSMPSAEPGPVATERASQTDFEVEPVGRGPSRPVPREAEEEDEGEGGQNPTMGTIIALIVIAAIILLNIIGGGE